MTRWLRAASHRSAAVLLPTVLTVAPLAAQRATRADMVRAIDSIAVAALDGGRCAGLSLAVVRDRDTLVFKGYGFVDLEWKVPTPDRGAVYEIGSVTKQFTAAAVLLLAEEGKLSLDDDLTRYLPDYPTGGRPIPIHRLLDHTSGIKGYTEMAAFRRLSLQKLPRDTLVKLISAEPFDFPPGDALVYNNSAYFLLGLIIEKVSGRSYETFVEERLFAPAGMKDSRYCSESAVVERRAHGYDARPTGLIRAVFLDHTWPYAAGSLCSTTGDLIAWSQALHGGRILSAESYRAMISPEPLNDGTMPRYAKGLSRVPVLGHETIQHGGGINGFLSDLAYFPESRTTIAVLVNTAGPVSPGELSRAIAEVVLGRKPERESAFSGFRGDAADLAGTYRGPGRGQPLVVTVAASGDSLSVKIGNGPAAPLTYRGGQMFSAGARDFTFVRGAGGVTGLKADLGSVVVLLGRQ